MSTDQPFATLHSQRLFLLTDGRRDALSRLDDGLGAREPFVLLTGVPGIGKTALVQEAIARWGTRVVAATVTNPALSRNELIEEIGRRFGAAPPTGASKPQLLAALDGALAEIAARDQIAVLVLEDAHHLTVELLDELRLLANAQLQAARRIEIVMVGLAELDATLARPELSALRQRIGVHCHLVPLTQRETRSYLHHRMDATGGDGPRQFPRKACGEIQHRTGGVPRAINTLAAEALRRARESGHGVVTAELVRAAAAVVADALATIAPPAMEHDHGEDEPESSAADVEAQAMTPASSSAHSSERNEAAPEANVTEATTESEPDAVSTPRAETAVNRSDAAAAMPAAPVAAVTATAGEAATPASVDDLPTMRPPVERSNDPRAQEWVRRFIGDDGPPRIGARLGWDSSGVSYSEDPGDSNEVEASGIDRVFEPGQPPAPPAPPKSRKKASERSERGLPTQRWLTTDQDASPGEPPTANRAPSPPAPEPAAAPQKWSAIHTAIIVIIVIAALAVLILPRAHRSPPRPAAVPSAVVSHAPQSNVATSVSSTPSVEFAPVEKPSSDSLRMRTTPPGASDSPATMPDRGKPSRRPEESQAQSGSAPTEISSTANQVDSVLVRRFALDVASFIDQIRAKEERERLAELTQLTGWVTSSTTGYHIMLGTFSTRERAVTAANVLLERGVLWQARVVELKPRRQSSTTGALDRGYR